MENKPEIKNDTERIQAIMLYRQIREITKLGFDVEVKEVRGVLKLYKIQKKAATEFVLKS